MDNHIHLLIHSKNIKEVAKIMQKTNTSYAKLYNKKNNRVGYVFRDRYYTQMILSQEHLYNCVAYIHNNPVKANIVKKIEQYAYSSYIEYLGQKELITSESIELVFGTRENFFELFNKIHRIKEIEDIADILELEPANDIIDRFINEENKNIEEIKLNENLFCKLLIELRYSGGLSLRDMSKIFNINKDKINKIINKAM